MDIVDQYLTDLSIAVSSMPRDAIRDATRALFSAWQRGATMFLLGNGGSAATASHMANDLNKQTTVPGKPRVRAMALTDNVPLVTAWANDASYEHVFVEQVLNFLRPGDVMIAISTSGESANVVKALEIARERGAVTIGFTGRTGGRMAAAVDHCICVPSDHIGQQEDLHLTLNHLISASLRQMIVAYESPA